MLGHRHAAAGVPVRGRSGGCLRLSDEPLFFLINSYTTGLQPAVLTYMLSTELKSFGGHCDSQEVGLPVSSNGLVLPCGASGRWMK